MDLLFEKHPALNIVRLTSTDAKLRTDMMTAFTTRVAQSEDMYPNIKRWVSEKVIPGLKSNERTAFIGFEHDRPVITAVVKKGEMSKFCHLRIGEGWHDRKLGNAFFCQMAWECRGAKEVHFTLPESLWERERIFFESFGFEDAMKAQTQYRLFDPEWRCSAPLQKVWHAAREKMPSLCFAFGGHEITNRILLSVRPNYAEEIIRGQKATR